MPAGALGFIFLMRDQKTQSSPAKSQNNFLMCINSFPDQQIFGSNPVNSLLMLQYRDGVPLAQTRPQSVHSPTVFAFHFAFVPVQFVVRSANKLFSLFTLLMAQGRRGTVVRWNSNDFLPACVHFQIALRPVNIKLSYH